MHFLLILQTKWILNSKYLYKDTILESRIEGKGRLKRLDNNREREEGKRCAAKMYKAPLISALILLISLGMKSYVMINSDPSPKKIVKRQSQTQARGPAKLTMAIFMCLITCYKWFCKTMFGIELNDRSVSCRHNKRWTLYHISSNWAHDMLCIYRVFCSCSFQNYTDRRKTLGGF